MRTRKGVTPPNSRKTAPRAQLRSVLGIYLSDDSLSPNLVADHIEDHATRPDREPSIPCLSAVFSLLKIQILEYKNAILGSPLNEFLGSAVTEILSSTRSLNSQPFESSNNTSSILSLCLSLSERSLKALDGLRSALVLDLPIQAAYEKLVAVCINSGDSISLIEINTNRVNSFNIGKFNCIGYIANKPVSKILDYNAINLSGIAKVLPEGIRNSIFKAFSAIDCENAQKTIFYEIGISPPLSDKEEGKRPMPVERMIHVMTILLGGSISTSSKPDACTGKLARYCSSNIAVDSAMQIKSFKRFAKVPSSLRYAVAYLSKAIESPDERIVSLDNYLQGSLSKHQLEDTTMRINTLLTSGGDGRNFSPVSGLLSGFFRRATTTSMAASMKSRHSRKA